MLIKDLPFSIINRLIFKQLCVLLMGQILCLPVDLIVKFLFQILLELPKLVQAPAHIQLLLIIKGDHLRSALKLPMLRLFPLELYFL
jgi:hypothetical protein